MPRHDTPQWRPIGERRWRDGLPPSSAERYETRGQLDSTAVSGVDAVLVDALDRMTTGKDIGPTALINALSQAQREIERVRRLFDPDMLRRMEAWERSQLDGRAVSGGHQHEGWQIQESAKGGYYCAACGEHVDGGAVSGDDDPEPPDAPIYMNADAAHGWGCGWVAGWHARDAE